MDNSKLIADALLKTDPDLAGSVDSASAFANELKEMGARVSLYRNYERGEHRAMVTDQMKRMLRLPEDGTGIQDFNDNYCKIVVDKMVSRLHISEITTPDNEGAQDWVRDMLERNDFDALQGMAFRGAIRDGDNFIMVDPRTLLWSIEPAYDGFSGVVAIFDGIQKTPTWACKIWSEAASGTGLEGDDTTSAIMKLVVYQPNRITYWVGPEGASEVRPDNIVTVAVDADGNGGISSNVFPWPLGKTPLVHIVNQLDLVSFGGESELRAAIPLQDVLNRTLHSMTMASEFSAFRIKWSIGMEIDANGITPGAVVNLVLKDASGNTITELTDDMAKYLAAVRVGEFEETDMAQYINQIDRIVREISQVTQTPIYGVTAQGNLSGEALKQLEIGLLGKVERFQRENTDSIRELITLTSQIQSSFITDVGGESPLFERVALTWAPSEILDVDAQIATLIKMRSDAPGLWPDDWYRAKIGALLGMSQSDVEKEGNIAKQQQQNEFETLVGVGGGQTVI